MDFPRPHKANDTSSSFIAPSKFLDFATLNKESRSLRCITHTGDSKRSSAENKQYSYDFKSILIKPRFDQQILKNELKKKMKEVRSIPIEYYEIKLYDLSYKYANYLIYKDMSFSSLEVIHHIYQLKKEESELSVKEKEKLDRNLEIVIMKYPTAWREYTIFKEAIEILACLMIKWNMVSIHDYTYRLIGRATNVVILDLKTLNENFFTVEGFWLTILANNEMLEGCLDNSVHQLGYILQTQTLKTISILLRMNNCDFEKVSSIEGYLAATKYKRLKKYNMIPDYSATPVPYQELSFSISHIFKCFRFKNDLKLSLLQESLSELELAYRSFEKALIESLLCCIQTEK